MTFVALLITKNTPVAEICYRPLLSLVAIVGSAVHHPQTGRSEVGGIFCSGMAAVRTLRTFTWIKPTGASGPVLPLSIRSFAAVQLPDFGHSLGVPQLDDGLAAVGTKPDIRVSRASRIRSGE